MEQRILDVLKETFELDSVDTTCSQQTCEAWDSMGSLNLAVELEVEFGISLTPQEIASLHSYVDILNILKTKSI